MPIRSADRHRNRIDTRTTHLCHMRTPQTVGMTVILLKSVYPSGQVINHTHRLGVPIKPDVFIIIGV